jgi:hypothetical protein
VPLQYGEFRHTPSCEEARYVFCFRKKRVAPSQRNREGMPLRGMKTGRSEASNHGFAPMILMKLQVKEV